MGLGVAIVQFKDLTKRQIYSLFSLNIGIAILLTGLLFVSAPFIAKYYEDETLTTIIYWLCISLFFNSLNIVPNGLMLKNKRFRDIALRTLSLQIISGTAACIAALNGWGIKALLISPIVTAVGVFTFNFFNYPQRPVWPIEMPVIKRIWGYSVFQFLFSVINYFSRNADKLIIGKYMSMKDLGYYDKSYRLMQMPLQNITFVITPVLHPILSSLQDNKQELSDKNIRLTQILSYVSFPLGIILYFCADPIISIIFGLNWAPAIPVFRILAISVPLQVVLSTSGSIYQAAGKTKHLFICGLQSAICTVGAFIFTAIYFKTINAMAWAWDIALFINFCFCYWFMYKYTFTNRGVRFLYTFLPQIINSIVSTLITILATQLWLPNNPIIQIIWVVMIVAVSTLTMSYVLRQYSIISIIHKVLKREE